MITKYADGFGSRLGIRRRTWAGTEARAMNIIHSDNHSNNINHNEVNIHIK